MIFLKNVSVMFVNEVSLEMDSHPIKGLATKQGQKVTKGGGGITLITQILGRCTFSCHN